MKLRYALTALALIDHYYVIFHPWVEDCSPWLDWRVNPVDENNVIVELQPQISEWLSLRGITSTLEWPDDDGFGQIYDELPEVVYLNIKTSKNFILQFHLLYGFEIYSRHRRIY